MSIRAAIPRLTSALHRHTERVLQVMALLDLQTVAHQERTAALAAALADRMGLSRERREVVRVAARLHDVGKLGVPPEIIHAPRTLDSIERDTIRSHATIGADLLRRAGFPLSLCELIESHHERLDGSGYPHGRSGDELSTECRILGVADVMDAMLSPRAHRGPCSLMEMERTLRCGRGTIFDERVVDVALDHVDSLVCRVVEAPDAISVSSGA